MENNNYLIDLTPLGNYYFGSENTFTSHDKININSYVTNYLVRSRKYPQQTTLLGIMRYILLLIHNKLNDKDKNGWDDLIGKSSFLGEGEGAPHKWGIISSISPLFIKRINENHTYDLFLPTGMDYQRYLSTNEGRFIPKKINSNDGTENQDHEHYYFDGFNNKLRPTRQWKNNKGELLSEDKIFIDEVFQVGIKKTYDGRTDNDAYFKQYFCRLKEGFSFAFFAELESEYIEIKDNFVISAGADQSLFNVKISKQSTPVIEHSSPKGTVRISLVSDAYVDLEIIQKCKLVISSSVDFRHMISRSNTKRYYNIGKDNGDIDKSGKCNLLERGSVLITDQPELIISALTRSKAYRNAGFNHYEIESITF